MNELERAVERLTAVSNVNGSCPGWGVVRQGDLHLTLAANRKMRAGLETVIRALEGIPAPQVNDGENCVYRTSDDVPEDIFIALSHARSALSTKEQPDV